MGPLFELREKRDQLAAELKGHQLRIRDGSATDGTHERVENISTGLATVETEIEEAEAAQRALDEIAGNGGENREDGGPVNGGSETSTLRTDPRTPDRVVRECNAARSAIEARSDIHVSKANSDRLEEVLARDTLGLDAAYIRSISDPAYQTAFLKLISGVTAQGQVLSAREQEAAEQVAKASSMRAMSGGEGKLGGFALPITLDPSVLLSSTGAVSPLRQLANVQTISTSEWKGVASAGVTASFGAELAEASDASPELEGPTVKPHKASAWVPFSVEMEDWGQIQDELARLFQDAKAVLEAEKLLVGSGTNEPFGILTGATNEVTTATEKKVVTADFYSLQAALPPRFSPGATFQMALASANFAWKLVGGGSTEPSLFNPDRSQLLLKPWYENSAMDAIVETSGKKVAIYGDVERGFNVIDRIGATCEMVPTVMGANQRPIGAHGLYFWWRVGSKVVVPNALRVLKIK